MPEVNLWNSVCVYNVLIYIIKLFSKIVEYFSYISRTVWVGVFLYSWLPQEYSCLQPLPNWYVNKGYLFLS